MPDGGKSFEGSLVRVKKQCDGVDAEGNRCTKQPSSGTLSCLRLTVTHCGDCAAREAEKNGGQVLSFEKRGPAPLSMVEVMNVVGDRDPETLASVFASHIAMKKFAVCAVLHTRTLIDDDDDISPTRPSLRRVLNCSTTSADPDGASCGPAPLDGGPVRVLTADILRRRFVPASTCPSREPN